MDPKVEERFTGAQRVAYDRVVNDLHALQQRGTTVSARLTALATQVATVRSKLESTPNVTPAAKSAFETLEKEFNDVRVKSALPRDALLVRRPGPAAGWGRWRWRRRVRRRRGRRAQQRARPRRAGEEPPRERLGGAELGQHGAGRLRDQIARGGDARGRSGAQQGRQREQPAAVERAFDRRAVGSSPIQSLSRSEIPMFTSRSTVGRATSLALGALLVSVTVAIAAAIVHDLTGKWDFAVVTENGTARRPSPSSRKGRSSVAPIRPGCSASAR